MFNQEQLELGLVFLSDLNDSLVRFEKTLHFSLKSKDIFRAQVAQDAQIYTFCECITILKELLSLLFDPEGEAPPEFQGLAGWLYEKSYLDERVYGDLLEFSIAEKLFHIECDWLSEEHELFTEFVGKIPQFYETIAKLSIVFRNIIHQVSQIEDKYHQEMPPSVPLS